MGRKLIIVVAFSEQRIAGGRDVPGHVGRRTAKAVPFLAVLELVAPKGTPLPRIPLVLVTAWLPLVLFRPAGGENAGNAVGAACDFYVLSRRSV